MQKVTLARNAMATRFEFVLSGKDPIQLRAAGEEALDEIDRIESQLSLYRAGSEISLINARAAFEAVRVSPVVFNLLERARSYWELSNGSFDITVAPLVRCWGFMKDSGSRPASEQIAAAREVVGMQHLELNPTAATVRFKRAGMMLDLGSIGKGYALDIAAEIIRDAGVTNALLHGGTSTICALGRDIEGPWKIALDEPLLPNQDASTIPKPMAVIELENQAMSVSAVWGKFFMFEGKMYGHVIDPRSGWPGEKSLLGCVIAKTAIESDALSTAVLLGTDSELEYLSQRCPEMRCLQVTLENSDLKTFSHGIQLLNV